MAILLLHGLGGDHRQPLALLKPVLPEGVTVIAPDVRAHGTSTLLGTRDDFTLDALAAEIAADLPDEPLTIIGISMGAAIGLRIALRVDTAKLVFIRPAFTDQSLPDNLAAFPAMGELLQTFGAEHAEKLFRETDFFHSLEAASPLAAEGAIEQFRKPDAAGRAIRLIEIPQNAAFESAAELAGVTAPASIITAPRDPVHPVDVAELWARSLPNASLSLVPARDADFDVYVTATRASVTRALKHDVPA